MTDADLIAAWTAWMRALDRAPVTLRLRTGTLRAFATDHELRAAGPHDIALWLALRSGGASRRAGHLAALRGFYRWAQASGHVDRNPAILVPAPYVPQPHHDPAPEHVVANALACANERTWLAVALGAYAGLRRAEIAAVHGDDVTGVWLSVLGKGGRRRVIPIHPILRPRLSALNGWAFPAADPGEHLTDLTVSRWITDALGAPWTAHSLRRRFATQAYRATRDIRAVQQLLGHASPRTTALYVRADDDSLTAAVLAVA